MESGFRTVSHTKTHKAHVQNHLFRTVGIFSESWVSGHGPPTSSHQQSPAVSLDVSGTKPTHLKWCSATKRGRMDYPNPPKNTPLTNPTKDLLATLGKSQKVLSLDPTSPSRKHAFQKEAGMVVSSTHHLPTLAQRPTLCLEPSPNPRKKRMQKAKAGTRFATQSHPDRPRQPRFFLWKMVRFKGW